jgi:hypothetical protein
VTADHPEVSLVVPCHNEAENLSALRSWTVPKQLQGFLAGFGDLCQVGDALSDLLQDGVILPFWPGHVGQAWGVSCPLWGSTTVAGCMRLCPMAMSRWQTSWERRPAQKVRPMRRSWTRS